MDKDEIRVKHCEMIQGVINRMSQNSFAVKSWTVLIISAIFALAAERQRAEFLLVGLFPTLIFWILDGYYLWHGRAFRSLYDHIRKAENHESNQDLTMDIRRYKKEKGGWPGAVFSKTLLILYGSSLAIVVAIYSLTQKCGGN